MTPEQFDRTVEFILQSQANAAARMEQIEADRQKSAKEFEGWTRESETWRRESETWRRESEIWKREFQEKLDHQRDNIQGLMRISHDLLRITQGELDRIRSVEGRGNAVEEMTRFLREVVESNRKRSDSAGPLG